LEAAGEYAFSKTLTGVYKMMLFNGNGVNARENNNVKDYVLYAGLKLPMNITVAGTFYSGKSGVEPAEVEESAMAAIFQIKQKRFTAQAEYITATYKSKEAANTEPAGFYAYGTYMITPAIEVGARYDVYENDKNRDQIEKSKTTLLAGYWFNPQSRLFLNYELRNDDANDALGNLLIVQLQVAF
jgi:hypothetical protein